MIRSFTVASLAILCLAGTAAAETRSFDVGSFSALDVSAGIEVDFNIGNTQSVTVENKKDDFSDISVSVKDDTLILKRKKKNWGWGKKRLRYSVTVTAPLLSDIEASSGSDVTGSGLTGDVSIDVSSGADVTITEISAGRVSLESSSGSDLNASGQCDMVDADASSGSDIRAGKLVCQSGQADASSGSDITIHVTGKVAADVSSGADVIVRGGPTDVTTDKSSGGSVKISG